jgi:uncharacterized protein (TIGR01777 family)
MKTLITGATGLIGRRLIATLENVRVLSRSPERAAKTLGNQVEVHRWPGGSVPLEAAALEGVDTVVHLAGEPIAAARWSDEQKERIRASRVEGTRSLVAAIRASEKRPKVLVCASAIGFYGDRGDEELRETASPGTGFLSDVCVAWEEEAHEARALGVRVVTLRIGVVLASDGGALDKMLLPFKMGVGGRLGHGRQWMPWVHVDDVVGLVGHAIETQELDGPMNAVSPGVVTNADFTRALGRALRRPAVLFVPRFALRAALGQLSELLFASHRVVPTVAAQTGYTFRFSELDEALRECVGP